MEGPKTFLIGVTQPNPEGLYRYLNYTEQQGFKATWNDAAVRTQIGESLCLVSFYAKLCYRSLVEGKNENVTRVRNVESNLKGCIDSGHGSVFEHCWLNWVTTGCSRVFTHELVRHRVGTAFSQTSGRYCTVEDAELVLPDELEEILEDGIWVGEEMRGLLSTIKAKVAEWRTALRLDEPGTSFSVKKRLTSALRRIMPNGATNEIGWSCNVRSLRHMIEMRTSRHAEWEIRTVFNEVAEIVENTWPLMLYGGTKESVDGQVEWTGLKL